MVLSGQQCPAGDQEGVGLVQWRCHETHQDMVTGTVKTPGDHDWWVLSWSRQHGSVILMKDKKQTLSVMKVTKELCCLSVCQTTVCMNSHICGCVLRTFHNYASNNVCMCESIKRMCNKIAKVQVLFLEILFLQVLYIAMPTWVGFSVAVWYCIKRIGQ